MTLAPPQHDATTLPHNREAERAILGTVILEPQSFGALVDAVPSRLLCQAADELAQPGASGSRGLMFETPNQLILGACVQMVDERRIGEITLSSIAAVLEEYKCLDIAGGPTYLASLEDDIFSLGQIGKLVEVVLENWRKRVMLLDARELFRNINKMPVSELIGGLRSRIIDPIEATLGQAAPRSGEGLKKRVEGMIEGRIQAVPFPGFGVLSRATKALMPGTVTLIAGKEGSKKSLFLLQCALGWHEQNIPVAIYMLEDNHEFHMHRALAIRAGDADLIDDEKLRTWPHVAQKAAAAEETNRTFMDSFAKVIHERRSNHVTLREVGEWVYRQAKGGKRIIVVDPITMAETGPKRYLDDQAFMDMTKMAAELYGCSVILINHLDRITGQMAGGQVYPRAAQTVMYIAKTDAKQRKILATHGCGSEMVNAEIFIHKARNSAFDGKTVGLWFENETLRMSERGFVEREKRGKK